MLAPVAPEGENEMKSPSLTWALPAVLGGASLAPVPAAPGAMLKAPPPISAPPLMPTAMAALAVVMVPSSTA